MNDALLEDSETEIGLPQPTALQLTRLTIADVVWALVIFLAGLLRFANLGRIPLSPAEAQAALPNWQFWQPGPLLLPITSPAYFTFTNLLFPILGDNDAVARLIPALFGLATVGLPWLLRGRLGNLGALAATVVLAFSPLLINLSRTAGGDAIAFFAITLLLVAALRFRQSGAQRWAIVLGAALGLGLASAPLFLTGLVTLAVAWYLALHGRPDRSAIWQIAPQTTWKSIGVATAVTFLLVSTFFLLQPQGLGAAARIFVAWLGQFGLPFNEPAPAAAVVLPFQLLGRYEPILLLALPGLAAALWSLAQKEQPGLFFVTWVVGLLLFWLLQPGVMNHVAIAILPLALLIASATQALGLEEQQTPQATPWMTWAVAGGILFLGMLILVSLARFSRLAASNPANSGQLFLATLGVIAAAALLFAAATWDSTAALKGLWLGAAGLLLYFQWGTGWHLNHIAANNPQERWVTAATHSEVRLLVKTLEDISQQTVGSDHDLAIFSVVESPVLRWYLRDFYRFQSGAAVPVLGEHDVVISPVDTELALASDYIGSDFRLLRQQPTAGTESQFQLLDTLHGWLFHESRAPVDDQAVIVWVRSNLINP